MDYLKYRLFEIILDYCTLFVDYCFGLFEFIWGLFETWISLYYLFLDYLWIIWKMDYLRLFVFGLFVYYLYIICCGLFVERKGSEPECIAQVCCLVQSAAWAPKLPVTVAGTTNPCQWPVGRHWVSVKETKVLLTQAALASRYGPSPCGPARGKKRVYVTQHF